jgi:hypothetical protein
VIRPRFRVIILDLTPSPLGHVCGLNVLKINQHYFGLQMASLWYLSSPSEI